MSVSQQTYDFMWSSIRIVLLVNLVSWSQTHVSCSVRWTFTHGRRLTVAAVMWLINDPQQPIRVNYRSITLTDFIIQPLVVLIRINANTSLLIIYCTPPQRFPMQSVYLVIDVAADLFSQINWSPSWIDDSGGFAWPQPHTRTLMAT